MDENENHNILFDTCHLIKSNELCKNGIYLSASKSGQSVEMHKKHFSLNFQTNPINFN